MGPTIFMEVYALYMTSHPRFMTSQHYQIHQSIIFHIKLNIPDNTSTASLNSHPDYRSYNPHCVYDNTGTICMNHVNTYDSTFTLYDIKPRNDIHIHCIHVITPRIHVVASTVAELLLTFY